MEYSSALDGKIRVWCLMRDQFSHIKPVEDYFGSQAEFIYDSEWDPEKMLSAKPDIIVCVNEYQYDIAKCIIVARENRIPSLLFQDGILEWRCQYENPLFGAGGGPPQHQPVLSDKIACIGHQSARQIAAWGNVSKVEVTGMPRLDSLLNIPTEVHNNPVRQILVMTAKNPGFTPKQIEITLRSLQDLKKFLESFSNLEIIWRVSNSLVSDLGIENQLKQFSPTELASLIQISDFVITTASTSILEAMLLNRPVAVLDYHNTPRFVQTAWTISSPEQIATIVSDLMNPPANKVAYQRDCLIDSLSFQIPSSPRAAELIKKMIAYTRKNYPNQIVFPPNMLGMATDIIKQYGSFVPPSLEVLYPQLPSFQLTDINELQLMLARALKDKEKLENQVKTQGIRKSINQLITAIKKRFIN
jgi:hypothetical protein